MLRVALADDASHAVALDNLAVLTDRLHACANFHRRSETDNRDNANKKIPDQTLTVARAVSSGKGPPYTLTQRWTLEASDFGARSSSRTASIAARRSGAAVTIRPTITYVAPALAASRGVTTRA